MLRVISLVLVACISEARPPSPGEMSDLTARIRHEAFPRDPPSRAWECAWCVACAALGGTVGLDFCSVDTTTQMIMTYGTSLPVETPLDARVHGSAADAWIRVRLMETSGIEAMVLGPDGKKLSGDGLGQLAYRERQISRPDITGRTGRRLRLR